MTPLMVLFQMSDRYHRWVTPGTTTQQKLWLGNNDAILSRLISVASASRQSMAALGEAAQIAVRTISRRSYGLVPHQQRATGILFLRA